MARADDYRRFAIECLALAQRTDDNPSDRRLLEMANAFNELAKTVSESTAPENKDGK